MVQKGTGNTARKRSLGVKFRERNKSRRIRQSPGSHTANSTPSNSMMCSAIHVMAPSLSLICRSTGWNCLSQNEIKDLHETEVKAELFEFRPTRHNLSELSGYKNVRKHVSSQVLASVERHSICSDTINPG